MAKSFNRRWKVSVGPLSTEELGVKFRITKTLGKEPNSCDLQIFNLSEGSRSKLTGARAPVVVEAGYAGEITDRAIIFSGEARTIDHVRTGPDWETHVQCGDGEKAYQFNNISKAFKKADFQAIVKEVAESLTPKIGNLKAAIAEAAKNGKLPDFTKGFVANGRSSDTLAALLKSVNLSFSIQDGELLVTQEGVAADTRVFVLTPETGLIGSPDHTPPAEKGKPATLKCKCLLNPQLKPASTVRIQSAGIKGDFIIQKLEHSGDSHGNEWITTIEAWAKK